ncbi:FAD-dependent oxidoreductase [Acetobacter sp. AN02]|uniref:FAD-dependent oxidoreductase n=1 Tax=Acetobacter sp. AN02 TaxID=2894186 RepID=UPI0024342F30|nr:FAD-dependent oxidoreductase [Acetobacter sp. AN02]MDG6093687.1 FAD-dependent oxidoreductase [Acetobacter sp. AN02]
MSLSVLVRGSGVAGLSVAAELVSRGVEVTVAEAASRPGSGASRNAGGMLAPWCEAESAPQEVVLRSAGAIDWWERFVPGVIRRGTLVVAPPRDVRELASFGSRTSGFEEVGAQAIAELEPDLAGRFAKGLFFGEEAHLDPRRSLAALVSFLERGGARIVCDCPDVPPGVFGRIVDARGLAARGVLTSLRGVRGEMLVLRCPDVSLQRPVRLLHPRIPVYIVPRADHVFMAGATMIESEHEGGITLRSMSELLGAVWTLHPAFSEAEIIETGTCLRPSWSDNVPRVTERDGVVYVNGMYRHGFLLAPDCARRAADLVCGERS